jgi:murein DD-endopeptidase MepM/ murein hydrolase activator NlpD
MQPNNKNIILIIIGVVLALVLFKFYLPYRQTVQNAAISPASSSSADVIAASNKPSDVLPPATIPKTSSEKLMYPISNGANRVTKKPFGIYITPRNSPVSPEKFKGFHTGTDFETLPDEQNSDVEITAACTGNVLLKKWATGYGGVLVESCTLDNNPVTIIYGHLNIASININVGQTLSAGDKIGNLGKGFSQQTDGERKHLHFGIHKGASINILGYVQNQAGLSGWLDAEKYLE